MNLFGRHPVVAEASWVAPSASVIGRAQLDRHVAVWYGAVIRADQASVFVGRHSSIGDRAVISTTEGNDVTIGDHVSIGAGALLQSCIIQNNVSIGAGAIIMEGALVEKNAIVAPGAVVHAGQRIPSGQLWSGNPAQFERNLTPEELAGAGGEAEHAVEDSQEHREQFLPEGTAYKDAEKFGKYLEDLAAGRLFVVKKA